MRTKYSHDIRNEYQVFINYYDTIILMRTSKSRAAVNYDLFHTFRLKLMNIYTYIHEVNFFLMKISKLNDFTWRVPTKNNNFTNYY